MSLTQIDGDLQQRSLKIFSARLLIVNISSKSIGMMGVPGFT